MTLLLFAVLILLFCLNVPIAVAVGLSAVIAFVIDGNMNMILITQRLYAGADSFPLMAVPLFMIAGQLMGAGGISKRIVNFADALVGHLSGGLAAVSVVSAMFFAGISGSAAADTAAVGAILIPSMVRRGYTPAFSGAVQAAAGSIGVIIPPSIPMIIFGVLTGASIGKLFAAGILPGILMGLSLIGVCVWNAKRTETTDSTTKRTFSLALAGKALTSAIWALGAPFIIIGGILGGVFTATESAAVAVVYALFVGMFIHKELCIKALPNLFISASITSSVVMFIICAASIFSWYMAIQDIPASIASSILSLTDNRIILLLLINLLLLIAGTILETTAALILFVPVLVPMLPTLGIDPVQLGAIVVVNLAIGMLTPPLGVCTIVACSIAHTRIGTLAKAIVPFLVVLLLDLLLITFWAPLTTYLPNLFFK
ncbi:TRAP transporter large permease [Halodesulfovibrio sp. MK-HDV]|jgi:tripartite ATP-independent transporter DctM subunit|uniref:TRAP transporter large permease n=1 Tax=Halodesulfovibrio sp. MK-HDV TaxID=2599925 RepID=UPI00136D24DC|nr:TRAP transporter large permease [Halodesulfovibrio sp. MK-HDV]KAF1076615.1 C4-dicarboxylate TRAP transporter large permease protein DctM [Halodesulfovibrio sp. MK-HDV]